MQAVKLTFAAVVMAWLAAAFSAGAGEVHSAFETPEGTITAYVDGIAKQDFDAIVATTSADQMSTKFDFVAFVDRLRALGPNMPAPASGPLFSAINRAGVVAQIGRQVQFLVYGLMTDSDILMGKMVMMEPGQAAAFMASVDTARLAGLTLEQIGIPSPKVMTSEINKKNLARIAATYGADEATERVALLSFEGKHFAIGFSLLRYGDTWTINSQSSAIINSNMLGVPGRITPDEFAALLK